MFTYVVQEPRDAKRSVGQERGIMINNTEQFRNMVFWKTGEFTKRVRESQLLVCRGIDR